MTESAAAQGPRDPLLAAIEERRNDSEFMARLRERIATDGIPTGVDWQQAYEREAEKFQAETRVTSFLSECLRHSIGKGRMCSRGCTRYGKAVLRSEDNVEWLCGDCLGEPPPPGPMRF